MTINKFANAQWEGDLKSGKGQITTESGALKSNPYGFNTRFDGQSGTNPEELIAAAHAGCFSMALSAELGKAGITADKIETKCTISLEKDDAGFSVTKSHLVLAVTAPQADNAALEKAANDAKRGCPISKLLNADITLDATYNGAQAQAA
jgi:osmotically inducible protein OsmC